MTLTAINEVIAMSANSEANQRRLSGAQMRANWRCAFFNSTKRV